VPKSTNKDEVEKEKIPLNYTAWRPPPPPKKCGDLWLWKTSILQHYRYGHLLLFQGL
jgi:hypothetical protein